jgi:hypothetical protein
MRIHTRLGIIFFVMILFGCKDEASSPQIQGDPAVIWPIVTGNAWVYEHTMIDTTRSIFDTSTVTMTVLWRDTNQTFVGCYIRDFIFWYLDPGGLLAANRADGFYLATWLPSYPPATPRVARALPYPTFPGDTLTCQGLMITTQSLSTRILVPAGTYYCVKYDVSTNGESVGTIWAAPNIGIVKTSYRVALPTHTYTLQSCQIQ